MSYCEHDVHCPGSGGAHDAALMGREGLLHFRRQSKPMLRSGDPRKRAMGKHLSQRVAAAFPFLPKKETE